MAAVLAATAEGQGQGVRVHCRKSRAPYPMVVITVSMKKTAPLPVQLRSSRFGEPPTQARDVVSAYLADEPELASLLGAVDDKLLAHLEKLSLQLIGQPALV